MSGVSIEIIWQMQAFVSPIAMCVGPAIDLSNYQRDFARVEFNVPRFIFDFGFFLSKVLKLGVLM